MNFKVDAVITYVNSNDPTWQAEFEKYNGTLTNDVQFGVIRYHDSGTFELVLKSIRKFAPWINKVHIIVSSESQVPAYVDESVNVIYHKDFVPEAYLPMFNSCALEIFFPFLSSVENRFIYFNDDMILTQPLDVSTFFNEKGDPYSSIKLVESKVHENGILLNSYNVVLGQNQSLYEGSTLHGPASFRKDWLMECYQKYSNVFLEKLSPQFRSDSDLAQYVYQLYQLICKHCTYKEFSWKTLLYDKAYKTFDWSSLYQYVGICMNDSYNFDISEYVKLIKNYINV